MSVAKDQLGETILGAVVTAVAIGFLVFAMNQAGTSSGGGGYPVTARFDRVDGVVVGSDVKMSGVKVGAVSGVRIDPTNYLAELTLSLEPSVKIPDDSAARIASDGLLGGAYVALDPGGSAETLTAGGEILNTQGSIDLLTLFASFAQGGQQSQEAEPQ